MKKNPLCELTEASILNDTVTFYLTLKVLTKSYFEMKDIRKMT